MTGSKGEILYGLCATVVVDMEGLAWFSGKKEMPKQYTTGRALVGHSAEYVPDTADNFLGRVEGYIKDISYVCMFIYILLYKEICFGRPHNGLEWGSSGMWDERLLKYHE